MLLKDFQTHISKIMSIGYKLGRGEINKKQADVLTYDEINRFADDMRKSPGLQIPDKGSIIHRRF